eukprot:scaffold88524_cov19-Tisochrysis_lutea.AAC.1
MAGAQKECAGRGRRPHHGEVGRGTLHGLAAAALSSRMSELGVQNEPSRLLNAACILSKGEKRLHHTAGVVGLHKSLICFAPFPPLFYCTLVLWLSSKHGAPPSI